MHVYRLIVATLIFGVLTACNQTQVPATPSPSSVALKDAFVVSAKTKMLSENVTRQITAFSAATGQLRFRRGDTLQTSRLRDPAEIEDPSQIQTGDVINAGITPATPYGLLQEVTEVRTIGDEVIVQTQPVPMEQIIEEGQIEDFEAPFTIDQTALAQLQQSKGTQTLAPQGVTLAGFRYQTGFQNVDLSDGAGLVRASGNLDWNARIKMDLGFRWFRLNMFKTYVELDANEQFTLSGPGPATNLDKTVVLARLPGRPIQITVPIFNAGIAGLRFKIVFTPYLEIRMNLRGETSGQVFMNYKRQDTYQAGVEWTGNSGWQPVKSHVIRANNFALAPTNANLKFGMGPAAGIVFYGGLEVRFLFWTWNVGLANANVSVAMFGFVKLDANTTRSPQWTISAGVEAVANAQGSVVGFGFNHTTPIFSIERRIASGNFGSLTDAPTELITPSLSELEPNSVGLTWTPVTGSSSYLVERSTDGETYSPLTNGSSMNWTDSSAAAGRTYMYRVSALTGSE